MPALDELLIGTPRIEPSSARVTVLATCTEPADGLRLEGHLTGPVCLYARTVEATARIRPEPTGPGVGGTAPLQAACDVSEPCLWEPEHPFLYRGAVELWQHDRQLDERPLSVGIRVVGATEKQLLLNGKPATLRGAQCPGGDCGGAAGIGQWRKAGCHALVGRDFGEETLAEADRVGVLLVVRLEGSAEEQGAHSPSARVAAQRLHPSIGVWAVDADTTVAAVRRADPYRPVAVVQAAAAGSGRTEADLIVASGSGEEILELALRANKPVLACRAGREQVAPETFAEALKQWEAPLAEAPRLAGWIV